MKAVLISIQPKWCAKIASGKKTVEVRKNKPKIETPFKCYIYCTKGNPKDPHQRLETHAPDGKIHLDNGKVIGEFVCDAIWPMYVKYSDPAHHCAHREFPFTCLTDKQIMDYLGNGKEGYGWHISDLVIYEKPKKLADFRYTREHITKVMNSVCHWECGVDDEIAAEIRRAPQSWCYVEG